jgi:hypothetical protein
MILTAELLLYSLEAYILMIVGGLIYWSLQGPKPKSMIDRFWSHIDGGHKPMWIGDYSGIETTLLMSKLMPEARVTGFILTDKVTNTSDMYHYLKNGNHYDFILRSHDYKYGG